MLTLVIDIAVQWLTILLLTHGVLCVTGLEIERNPKLLKFRLPSLTSVGEDFHVFDNAVLETVECPKLETAGEDFYIGTCMI